MRSVLTAMLCLLALNLQAQQCVNLEPKVMGLPRLVVDLEQVEVQTLPIVFHVMHTGEAVGEGANITDENILATLE